MTAKLPPAIILAAGESSRFWPLSTHGHKSLHRICGRPVIEHTIRSLAGVGVGEIVIVQSPVSRSEIFPHRTIREQLGDELAGARLRYIDQPVPNGPGPTLRLATKDVTGDYFVVYPESVNAGDIAAELWEQRNGATAVVAGQEREETWLFGVFALDGDRLTGIVEKPEPGAEPSKVCNMAVGYFTPEYTAVHHAEPPSEIDNLTALETLSRRATVRVVRTVHPFFPLKYPWHLFAMADFLRPPGGPFIGEHVTVGAGASVDDGSVIEDDAVIALGVRVKRCLIGAGAKVGAPLADSILGAAVTIEPDAKVRNVPLDGGHVTVDVKGREINTALPALGTVVGHGSTVSRNAELAPGVLVGAEAIIAAGEHITGNVPDRSQPGE